MLRVSPQELKTYLALDAADDTDLSIFLEMGNMLVEDALIGKGLSDNRLKMVELNLDAHYACLAIEKGGLSREKAGSAEAQYPIVRTPRPNFSLTRYGQQAVVLDTSGVLSDMDSPGGVASIGVINPKDPPTYPGPGFSAL